MIQTSNNHEDPRLAEMLDVIFKFAAGDLTARGTLADDDSALDGVMAGINILGEELEAYVAERRQAEKALSESEAQLKAIFESVQDGIVVTDVQTKRFRMGNAAMCRMLGYGLDELLNLGMEDIHPEADLPDVARQFERRLKEEISVATVPIKRKDGTVFYADVSGAQVMLGGKSHLTGVFRDITERRKQEQALRESQERSKSILENVAEIFFIADSATNAEYMSPRCLEIYGYSADEFIANPTLWIETLHPEDRGAMMRHATEEGQSGARAAYEYRILRKDGLVRWVRSVTNPVMGADGKL